MKTKIGLWQLVGFAVTSLGGTLLHFFYDWLGEAVWIAPFSGVNESTWEHMKLLFWPMLAFAAVQSFFFKDRGDFWCIKLRGILLGMLLIPVIFYTYNGAVGRSPDWLNIAIFFVAAAGVYISAADYKHPVSAFSPLPRLPAVFLFRTDIPTLPHYHNGCDAHHPAPGAG